MLTLQRLLPALACTLVACVGAISNADLAGAPVDAAVTTNTDGAVTTTDLASTVTPDLASPIPGHFVAIGYSGRRVASHDNGVTREHDPTDVVNGGDDECLTCPRCQGPCASSSSSTTRNIRR